MMWYLLVPVAIALLWMILECGFHTEPEDEYGLDGSVKPPGHLKDDALFAAAQTTYEQYEIDVDDQVFGLSPKKAAKERQRIAEYRARAEALPDERWRNAHLRWVSCAERSIVEAENTWADGQAERAASKFNPL
jgi:hypothetical protein